MKLIEKIDDIICRICESNYLLDWITRVGLSDEGHLLMTVEEKPVKKVGRWLVPHTQGVGRSTGEAMRTSGKGKR